MANRIKPKNRSTDGTAPTTGDLVDGELAVNSFTKTLYLRVATNVIAVANYFSGAWSDITGTPTTLSGYGITDAALDANVLHTSGNETFGGVKTLLNRFEVADGDGHPKVVLQPSTAGRSGYVDFYDSDGSTHAGYMGYANSTTLNLYAAPGRGYDFNGGNDPTVGGKSIWHAGSAYITVGAQSGGGLGLLRLEDASAARSSWTVTGSRRWSAGNNGTGWTLRDESGGVNAITVSAGGNAAFSGSITAGGNTVWHAGNDGAGSGLDADTVDGYQVAEASTVSTVAARNSSGDIQARLFRSEYDSTNSSVGFIMTQVDTASNNYIRPSTPTQIANALASLLPGTGNVGYMNIPLTTSAANYTFTAADVGCGRLHTSTTSHTYTVPSLSTGDVLTAIHSASSGTLTLTGSGVSLYLMGSTGAAGNRTIAPRGVATIFFISPTSALVGGPGVS